MNQIFDLHNDFLTELKEKRRATYLSKLKNTTIMSAVWTSEMKNAIEKIESCNKFIDENNAKIDENYSVKLNLAVEDLHFLTKNSLARLINCAPKYCSLTWNQQNNLGGGAIEGGDLTPFGIETVKALEENDIFVDSAHLCEKSFMTLSRITDKPLLCTHTAFYSLTPNKRNLKDYQLKMIVESGGIVGLAFVSNFLCGLGKSNIEDVVKNINYFVCKFGDDNLCLGTDFYGTKKTPRGLKSYFDLPNLKNRLKKLGYLDETIDKIFYKNAEHFFKGKF